LSAEKGTAKGARVSEYVQDVLARNNSKAVMKICARGMATIDRGTWHFSRPYHFGTVTVRLHPMVGVTSDDGSCLRRLHNAIPLRTVGTTRCGPERVSDGAAADIAPCLA
jgi:hypothetical protein